MSYNTDYIFEGDYCRKPEQRLGGRSVPLQSREALVEKAAQERVKREKERVIAKSVKIIQAVVRGFLVRRRIKNENRREYIAMRNEPNTMEQLGRQISRFNSFHDPKRDLEIILEIGKCILPLRTEVFPVCSLDVAWAQRIRLFLRKVLETINLSKVRHVVLIRLVQAFSESVHDTPQSLLFYTNTWLDLVVCASFFSSWRIQLENCIPPSLASESNVLGDPQIRMHTQVLANVIKCVLTLVSQMETTDLKFSVKSNFRSVRPTFQNRTQLTGTMVANRILEKFTETYCDNVIAHALDDFRIVPHFLLTNLVPQMPWLQWVKFLESQYCDRFTSCSSGTRNLLYSILRLTSTEHIVSHTVEFWTPVLKLMHSIDIQFAPVPKSHFDHIDADLECDSHGEPWPAGTLEFFQESTTLYLKLSEVLKTLPPSLFVGKDTKWSLPLMTPVLSCIIRWEGRELFYYSFPGILAYNREFMRRLFISCISSGPEENPNSMHDVIVFTSTLTHLLATLHDAEFISGIPMSREELQAFIPQLVALYTETVLQDKLFSPDRHNSSAGGKIISNCLMSIHDRNTRMQLFPEEVFYSTPLQTICPVETHNLFFHDFNNLTPELKTGPSSRLSSLEQKLMSVLVNFPFALPFHERVAAWHRMIELDRSQRFVPHGNREHVQIRRKYIYEDAYEKLSPNNVADMRNPLRISLVNVVGAVEAGVDGGGLLREFLTEATKAGVDPNRGLFRLDSQNRIYPNPIAKKVIPEYRNHYYLIGRLVGKALYEQTLLELPLAAFFIQTCISSKVSSAVDYLSTLDPALHKQLLGLKNFSGDLTSLGLDFTLTIDEFGETRTVNLKLNGGAITVDKSNVIEYIHLVADYKINKEMDDECHFFRFGLCDVVPILRMFSWREMQTLISGSDKPIDIKDWMEHTNYTGGYSLEHPCIQLFWQVVHSFDEQHLRKLLKFVTSCSRPPLLGFKDLVPNFGIQNAGHVDRLPTSATCMNLLKLPEFTDAGLLRQKLVYAIEAQAGFELS